MKVVDWYFDFISPFAYIQGELLTRMTPPLKLRYQPVLFAGLLKHHGQLGPAEIASKRTFTYQYVLWRASSLGIPMQLPPAHPFNPLKALRLALACESRPDAIQAIFRFIWREGHSLEDGGAFEHLCHGLQIDPARLKEPDLKQRLVDQGTRAIKAGAFGVPTLAINSHLFWGEDATQMTLDYLAQPEQFTADYLAPAQRIPIGISRKV